MNSQRGQRCKKIYALQDMNAFHDPLDKTHSPASSDHYSRLNFVLFREILKSGDGRTDSTSEYSDH